MITPGCNFKMDFYEHFRNALVSSGQSTQDQCWTLLHQTFRSAGIKPVPSFLFSEHCVQHAKCGQCSMPKYFKEVLVELSHIPDLQSMQFEKGAHMKTGCNPIAEGDLVSRLKSFVGNKLVTGNEVRG